MSAIAPWTVGFSGIGGTLPPGTLYGSLSLFASAGPSSVTVAWGAPGVFGQPATDTYLPQQDGTFNLPGPNESHTYADGSYTLQVIGNFGGSTQTTMLTAFFDLNATAGTAKLGNALANLMSGGSGSDTFSGAAGDDWLFGGLGDDRSVGGAGNDFLGGSDGNDTLNGGAGSDLLAGDAGNDRLIGGAGTDFLYGDTGNDTLIAGTGNDYMDGGEGDDRLTGGPDGCLFLGGVGADMMTAAANNLAQDTFIYRNLAEAGDRIVNFESGTDKIELDFLSGPAMNPDHFVPGRSAMVDADPYIIYDPGTGRLSVDLDGTGPGAAVQIAVLAGKPALGFGDFFFGA